jgi:SAM-dependent methyltransferase
VRKPKRLTRIGVPNAARGGLERGPLSRIFPRPSRRARAWLDRVTIPAPDKLHACWTRCAPEGDVPEDFIGPVGRSEALCRLMENVPKDAWILEIGCNVGRNLAYLRERGYAKLKASEISPHTVDLLRRTYPSLSDVPVSVGPAQARLVTLADKSFDLVFATAVLVAIHPDHSAVRGHMARIAREILTVEPRGFSSRNYYPHDVPAVFPARGFELTRTARMEDFPEVGEALHGYFAHRFVECRAPTVTGS